MTGHDAWVLVCRLFAGGSPVLRATLSPRDVAALSVLGKAIKLTTLDPQFSLCPHCQQHRAQVWGDGRGGRNCRCPECGPVIVETDDVAALTLDEDWLRQKMRLAMGIESRDGINDLGDGVWRLGDARRSPVMQIVKQTGLSWSGVNRAIELYRAGGDSALKPAVRGKKKGKGRALTDKQEAELRGFIRMRRPWYYGLEDCLWSRLAVMDLIEAKYVVRLSERVIGNYLGRWGLTLPTGQPHGRCSSEIQTYLDRCYAEIKQQARTENAEIYWLNKPVPLSTDIWFPMATLAEVLPEVSMAGMTRKKLSMVSVVNNQGKVSWAISNGSFNADRQIKFIEALIRDTKRKVLFLILCDQVAFRSEHLRHWIRQNSQVIKVFPEHKDLR